MRRGLKHSSPLCHVLSWIRRLDGNHGSLLGNHGLIRCCNLGRSIFPSKPEPSPDSGLFLGQTGPENRIQMLESRIMTNSVVIAVQVEELAKDPGTSRWDLGPLGDETYTAPGSFNSNSP